MRRVTLWFLSTVAALVLLFSYRTSTSGQVTVTGVVTGTGVEDTDSGSTDGSGSGSGSGSGGGSGSGSADTATTVDGSAVWSRFGPVQVQITVSGGEITEVDMLQVPNSDHHDREINGRAVPILVAETLQAQSADIDTVSGATITSMAYRESLQAAIDEANLR